MHLDERSQMRFSEPCVFPARKNASRRAVDSQGRSLKEHAPRCFFPAPKIAFGQVLKAARRNSMLPDAFSRLRKMHLDERWVLEAARRNSMLPDAFSRLRKMHLDKRWILSEGAYSQTPKNASRRAVDSQGSFQMRFPGPEKSI